jgi:hypothetical protein
MPVPRGAVASFCWVDGAAVGPSSALTLGPSLAASSCAIGVAASRSSSSLASSSAEGCWPGAEAARASSPRPDGLTGMMPVPRGGAASTSSRHGPPARVVELTGKMPAPHGGGASFCSWHGLPACVVGLTGKMPVPHGGAASYWSWHGLPARVVEPTGRMPAPRGSAAASGTAGGATLRSSSPLAPGPSPLTPSLWPLAPPPSARRSFSRVSSVRRSDRWQPNWYRHSRSTSGPAS